MNYSDFQHLAHLFIAGALDHDELEAFTTGRLLFGERAEAYLRECRELPELLALSLRPMAPRPETKARLMKEIRERMLRDQKRFHSTATSDTTLPPVEYLPLDAFEAPLTYTPSYRN